MTTMNRNLTEHKTEAVRIRGQNKKGNPNDKGRCDQNRANRCNKILGNNILQMTKLHEICKIIMYNDKFDNKCAGENNLKCWWTTSDPTNFVL